MPLSDFDSVDSPQEPEFENSVGRGSMEMANEESKTTCARETCSCPRAKDSEYCGEECEEAAKVHMMEIGCTCRHAACR